MRREKEHNRREKEQGGGTTERRDSTNEKEGEKEGKEKRGEGRESERRREGGNGSLNVGSLPAQHAVVVIIKTMGSYPSSKQC